ncbi:MlaD family protein [Rudanella paleaurantiibacter]|nr:MlaD family protein [Rudanella paleaurantiibacter]
MKISQEVKVGILAVVALAMFYFGFQYLKGSDFFSSDNHYRVVYDNVDGLTASNAITLNGLAVGRVKQIEILQDQGNKLMVTVAIQKRIQIAKGTRAILADGGLLGGKVIQLQIPAQSGPLENEGMLVAAKEQGLQALIREKTLPVLNNVDSLTRNLNVIVKSFDQTGAALNATLASANRVTGTLDLTVQENRAALRTTLGNVNRLSASLIETERQLKPILAKVDNVADSLRVLELRATLANANRTVDNLQKLLAGVQQGKGSLGKLTSDEALYTNVNATTASLEKLLTDLRENPKRYVHFSLFGRKDKTQPARPGSVTTTTVITTRADSTQQP